MKGTGLGDSLYGVCKEKEERIWDNWLWLHLCSRKSIWSTWYWPTEFITSVLYLSCLQFCYWNNHKNKQTYQKTPLALLRPPVQSQFASWPLQRGLIFRISFCECLRGHTEMSCDTFTTILVLQTVKGKAICIPLSASFGQETSFT